MHRRIATVTMFTKYLEHQSGVGYITADIDAAARGTAPVKQATYSCVTLPHAPFTHVPRPATRIPHPIPDCRSLPTPLFPRRASSLKNMKNGLIALWKLEHVASCMGCVDALAIAAVKQCSPKPTDNSGLRKQLMDLTRSAKLKKEVGSHYPPLFPFHHGHTRDGPACG